VGISIDSPPLAYKRDGVIRGLEVDLARALAEALERDLRLIRLPGISMIDALRGGRIDLAFSSLPGDELEALGLAASIPILATGQMAMVRTQDIGRFARLIDLKLTDARVGYQRASLGARFVQARMPNAERVPFAGTTDGLEALRNADVDVFIHDATTAWLLAADPNELKLSAIYRALTDDRLRPITRAEDIGLRQELNRILASWERSGELERLISRWIPVQIRVGGDSL
jgi:ABC-type amino acid transport substrate-binding protein